MSKNKNKKRIRDDETVTSWGALRESIREEVLEEFVEKEQNYLQRIEYLVGANNEAMDLLKVCEDKCSCMHEELDAYRYPMLPGLEQGKEIIYDPF
jgi:hypothetical protein